MGVSDSRSYTVAWLYSKGFCVSGRRCASLYQNICKERIPWIDKEVIEFTGDTGFELQDIIKENVSKIITISNDEINVEQTIQTKSNIYLLGNSVAIHAEVECDVFSMENIYNLVITGVRVDGNKSDGKT